MLKNIYEINKNHINTEILNSEKILHNNILTPLEHAIDNNTNYVGSGHQAVVQQEIKLAEKAVDQQSTTKPVFLDGVPSPETKHKRKSKAKKDDTTTMVIDKPIEPL